MGWDGYAVTPDGEDLHKVRVGPESYDYRIADDALNEAFQRASKEVVEQAGWVDGFLHHGGLDLSGSAEWLTRLTDVSAYTDYAPWMVQRVVKERSAEWDRDYAPKERCPCTCGCACAEDKGLTRTERGYYLSARKFLEVCAAHGLGMRASY